VEVKNEEQVAGDQTAAQRRADLAMAAARGTTDTDVVLRSDPESLALLGVDEESPILADVLRWQGSVLRDQGKTDEAEALYQQSLRVAQHLDYLAGQSHAVNCLGVIAQRRGEIARAGQLFIAAQRMAEGCGDIKLAGLIEQNRGVIADIAGDCEKALEHYMGSLYSFERSNDERSMTLVLNNIGLLHFKLSRYSEARQCYDRALGLARRRCDLLSEGVIEENIAELEMLRGDVSAASESIARALEIAILRQDPLRRASALKLLGVSLRMTGRAEEALDPLRGALTICENADDKLLEAELLYETGLAYDATGAHGDARENWKAALRAFQRIGALAQAQWVQDAIAGLTEDTTDAPPASGTVPTPELEIDTASSAAG
jgi:tetratricopeptide (TPR) repeat protein